MRPSSSSASGQETEVARLTGELIEARELQAATAEVLRVISISPHDIQPVFDTIAQNAARIADIRVTLSVSAFGGTGDEAEKRPCYQGFSRFGLRMPPA